MPDDKNELLVKDDTLYLYRVTFQSSDIPSVVEFIQKHTRQSIWHAATSSMTLTVSTGVTTGVIQVIFLRPLTITELGAMKKQKYVVQLVDKILCKDTTIQLVFTFGPSETRPLVGIQTRIQDFSAYSDNDFFFARPLFGVRSGDRDVNYAQIVGKGWIHRLYFTYLC